MKTWIHQIKEKMRWQEQNYRLLYEEYLEDPTPLKLNKYVQSYGDYRELKGRYEQWHKDQREFEEAYGL